MSRGCPPGRRVETVKREVEILQQTSHSKRATARSHIARADSSFARASSTKDTAKSKTSRVSAFHCGADFVLPSCRREMSTKRARAPTPCRGNGERRMLWTRGCVGG